MRKNMIHPLAWFLSAVLACVPLMVISISWHSVPDRVPVHFGMDGSPDRWGSKWEWLVIAVVIGVLFLVLFSLIRADARNPERDSDEDGYEHSARSGVLRIRLVFVSLLLMEVATDAVVVLLFLRLTSGIGPMLQYVEVGPAVAAMTGIVLICIGNLLPVLLPAGLLGFHIPLNGKTMDADRRVRHYSSVMTMFLGLVSFVSSFWLSGASAVISAVVCAVASGTGALLMGRYLHD